MDDEIFTISMLLPESGDFDWHTCEWEVRDADGQSIARCATREAAKLVQDALIYQHEHPENTTSVHIHIDGRAVAKAVRPHLTSNLRSATGTKGF